jgi:hypothetical protein
MPFVPRGEGGDHHAGVGGDHRRVFSSVSLTMSSVSLGSLRAGTATGRGLDLEPAFALADLERPAAGEAQALAQRLRHDHAAGGVNGGFHGRSLPIELVPHPAMRPALCGKRREP